MAVPTTKGALSVGQRVWNALSAWCIRNAGYQKYGKGSNCKLRVSSGVNLSCIVRLVACIVAYRALMRDKLARNNCSFQRSNFPLFAIFS